MKFSIIIPTFKRHEDLSKCLDRLAHYFAPQEQERLGFGVEVIVSDDARESELKAMLAEQYPWATYLEGPSRGPAANRNNGAKHASGDWIVFTDDDCLPQPGWLEAYSVNLSKSEVLEGRTKADRARQRLDEESPLNETGGYLWSCNFAIRSQLFDALGGFDETFPHAAMEDVEFRERLNDHRLKPFFVPSAVVVHPFRRVKNLRMLWLRHASYLHLRQIRKQPIRRKDARAYYFRSLRSFVKISLPGLFRYKGKGIHIALAHDLFYFFLATKTALFPLRKRK